MKLLDHPPLQEEPPARLRLVGAVLYAALALLAAAVGAAVGVILVYSTDLPQVAELERYRPSSVTELYDTQNRVIGTFALQRRVIAYLRRLSAGFARCARLD